MKFQVVDKESGELYETEYESIDQLREQYLELDAEVKAKTRLLDKVKADIKAFMNEDGVLDLGEGYSFKKTFSTYKGFNAQQIAEVIREYDFEPHWLLSPDNAKIKDFLKEHLEDGGDWAQANAAINRSEEVIRVVESLKLVKPEGAK